MNIQQFSEKFRNLKKNYPRHPSHIVRCENAELGDYLASCQNANYSFDDAQCKDIIFIYDSFKAVNCGDGDYVVESENCYECVDVLRVYNSSFLNYCSGIYDSSFCYNCHNCDHLFGCANLQYKKYCIFNRQYRENEYEKKINELKNMDSGINLQKLEDLKRNYPVTVTHVANSENCDYGNQVFYSKNLYLCFDSGHSENGGYLYDAHYNKNCFDLTQTFHSEFCYECVDCARLNSCFFMKNCEDTFDSAFCEDCSNSNHLLGCIALDKKEYCILNKKYSEEKYKEIYRQLMDSYQIKGSGKSSF